MVHWTGETLGELRVSSQRLKELQGAWRERISKGWETGNGFKLPENRFRLGLRKNSYPVRVVMPWNRIPGADVAAPEPWKCPRTLGPWCGGIPSGVHSWHHLTVFQSSSVDTSCAFVTDISPPFQMLEHLKNSKVADEWLLIACMKCLLLILQKIKLKKNKEVKNHKGIEMALCQEFFLLWTAAPSPGV